MTIRADLDYQTWQEQRRYTAEKLALARLVLEEIRKGKKITDAVHRHPLPEGGYIGKHLLVTAYRELVKAGEWVSDPEFLARIRMKPVRTLSGVTTVTVLTKPYPCPGKCIFCPTDMRMPKSYLPDEPGARRALEHAFDPFDQVTARIAALEAIGHPADKIELLILGGTWGAYPRAYQEWFIRRCFEALNGAESENLQQAQTQNENASHRNVGLVVETRPDHIDPKEIAWMRYLGVTKVQIGAQSLDDEILQRNQRGHSVADTSRAVMRLRAAGFKIVLHWMPNLLGATPQSDREDFARLWERLCPDEIKIYPNQLLEESELYQVWLRGEFQPYTTEELISLIADIKTTIPRYCRVNRVIRDIPSTYVVAGNKRTSLRQDIQLEMRRRGKACQCIRCREVSSRHVSPAELSLVDLTYHAETAEEHFLSLVNHDDMLAGFLRLSLPTPDAPDLGLLDLKGAAIIREVHVFGQAIQLGIEENGAAQHAGLGAYLLCEAELVALKRGFQRLAVISAVGTRQYYLRHGFSRGEYYLIKPLSKG